MPQNGVPTPVLPNFAIAASSPLAGLQEIRTSFSLTLASIESALPQVGALPTGLGFPGLPLPGGIRVPQIQDFFKGPAGALAAVQDTVQALVAKGPLANQTTQRGDTGPQPEGKATRGML